MKGENYLRTDALTESISSLRVVENEMKEILNDMFFWKPVIIMLHNSLQGFMVCTLRGTNNYNILKKDTFNNEEKLLNFMRLYSRIKSPKYNHAAFNSSNEIDTSVYELNKWRNDFIHFIPKGLSLEVTNMPLIISDIIKIINFIVFKSNTLYQLTEENLKEIQILINSITIINNEISLKYNSR